MVLPPDYHPLVFHLEQVFGQLGCDTRVYWSQSSCGSWWPQGTCLHALSKHLDHLWHNSKAVIHYLYVLLQLIYDLCRTALCQLSTKA